MIFPIILLTILGIIVCFISIIVIKEDTNERMKKIHDSTSINTIIVVTWVILVLLIPISPQTMFSGDLMLILIPIGICLIVVGIINLIWLFKEKRGIGAQEMQKLLTTGAYGIARHPIYLSHQLLYFGIIFLRGSYDALVLSPIVIILYIIVAKTEENYSIGKTFKDDYTTYQREVPMFLNYKIFLLLSAIFVSCFLISLSSGLLQIQF
jgi:protein-S-isoprenylcysteine O-methyltransferase Ste14